METEHSPKTTRTVGITWRKSSGKTKGLSVENAVMGLARSAGIGRVLVTNAAIRSRRDRERYFTRSSSDSARPSIFASRCRPRPKAFLPTTLPSVTTCRATRPGISCKKYETR